MGTRVETFFAGLLVSAGLLSTVVALALPDTNRAWRLALPGLCYNVLMLMPVAGRPLALRTAARLRAEFDDSPAAAQVPASANSTRSNR